jgi:hypothetical protein
MGLAYGNAGFCSLPVSAACKVAWEKVSLHREEQDRAGVWVCLLEGGDRAAEADVAW